MGAPEALEMFSLHTWVSNMDLKDLLRLFIPTVRECAKIMYNPDNLRAICVMYILESYSKFYKMYTDASKDDAGMGVAFYDSQSDGHIKLKITTKMSIIHAKL